MRLLLENHHSILKKFLSDGAKNSLTALFTVILLLLVASGCGSGNENAREVTLAPLTQMPAFVQEAPTNVQEAYRFAVANPDLLQQMPCYCGCGSVGHISNIDCYVKSFNADGSVAEFENHAAL